ncbi:MAG: acyltransferase [Oscillospiraceae bacterium]|nr:acyltransferase [Oscillospiraceae bacterium]
MRFQTIFKYRKNMMAAAIVMILLYHTKGAWPEIALKRIAGYFYGGVDLFFFASGIGCYFSYCRDRDAAAFFRRRCARILPVYVPFALCWIAVEALGAGISFSAALANLFGVHGFLDIAPSFNWYVSGMWLSYLLAPFLAPLAERCDNRVKAIGAVLALLLFSCAFWGDTQLIIIVTRLPVFFAGMLFAAESERREALTKAELALLLALIPVGAAILWESPKFFADLVWSHGLAWYPMLLIAPGLCVAVAAVSAWLDRFAAGRGINKVLGFLGGITFEIYLVHFWALEKPLPMFLGLTALYTAALHLVSGLIQKKVKTAKI